MSFPTSCTLSPLSLLEKSQRLLLSLSLSQELPHFPDTVSSLMDDDWDLYAVVRGCTTVTSSSSSTATTTTTASSISSSAVGTRFQPSTPSTFSVFPVDQPSQVFPLSNPFEAKGSIEGLHELCKPFFLKSQPPPSFSYSPKSPPQTQQKQQQHSKQQSHHDGSATTPRSKRRRNQLTKVCQVSEENLSSDIWAWRKYGQKLIRGSPYPRGYYRCSSSKACIARKQVERNKSEPTMFIVTYTGEHNHRAPTHRNSLAGSTRQKPLTPQTAFAEEGCGGKSLTKLVSPATPGSEEECATPLSAMLESKEDVEDLLNDEFGVSDNVVTNDFFEGLDELTESAVVDTATAEDSFADPVVAFPSWVVNNDATAAGGS